MRKLVINTEQNWLWVFSEIRFHWWNHKTHSSITTKAYYSCTGKISVNAVGKAVNERKQQALTKKGTRINRLLLWNLFLLISNILCVQKAGAKQKYVGAVQRQPTVGLCVRASWGELTLLERVHHHGRSGGTSLCDWLSAAFSWRLGMVSSECHQAPRVHPQDGCTFPKNVDNEGKINERTLEEYHLEKFQDFD